MSKGATSQNEVASSRDATASGGGSSLPAPTHTSAGGRSYRRGRGNESRAGDFACSGVQLAHGRRVHELPAETIKTVNRFPVPAGFRREVTRETSCMYSIGVYARRKDRREDGALLIIKRVHYLLNST